MSFYHYSDMEKGHGQMCDEGEQGSNKKMVISNRHSNILGKKVKYSNNSRYLQVLL